MLDECPPVVVQVSTVKVRRQHPAVDRNAKLRGLDHDQLIIGMAAPCPVYF
jgi:hypothetical protein